MPSTVIPYWVAEESGTRRGRRVDSTPAGVGSPAAESPCLRRCMTFWTTTLGEILAAPRAM